MTAKGAILPDTRFSTREIIFRLFLRLKLFLFCSIFIPLFLVALVYMVPPTYKATSKIIIKHNDSVTPFFNEIVTSREQGLSGQSNVEILRSLPICKTVVQKLDLKSHDFAKPAYNIILPKIARIFFFWKKSNTDKDTKNGKTESDGDATRLAEEFKDTITPKIIEKGRNSLFIQDELIEVEVKSFSREKVALITNTLCQEFIDEYYRIYEKEAAQAYDYLSKQIALTQRQIIADTKERGKLSGKEWAERNINTNPIVARISRQVAELENELFRLQNIYASNAPEVKKAKAELDAAVERLADYRSAESADAILNVLTEKRRAAYMTLQLYKNRLVPISIVEEAVPPKKSSLGFYMRYGIAGGAGLIVGILTGFILVMFFSAIDNKLYTPWDIERNTDLEVIGSIQDSYIIPKSGAQHSVSAAAPVGNTVVDMLGLLDLMNAEKGQVLLVTSPARNEGKTTVAFQAAMTLAKDKSARTLLIDANFIHPDLSSDFNRNRDAENPGGVGKNLDNGAPIRGMVDVLVGDTGIKDVIHSFNGKNFDIILLGNDQKRKQVGFYKKRLSAALNELRDMYDLVIIDSPGLLSSVDAALFASEADSVVLVVRSGATRMETIENALSVLKRSGGQPVGVILNFRKFPVPGIFYG